MRFVEEVYSKILNAKKPIHIEEVLANLLREEIAKLQPSDFELISKEIDGQIINDIIKLNGKK